MKIGLAFASSVGTDGDSALEICRRAEAIGFESVWGGEHVVLPDSIDSRYPYTPNGKIPAESDAPIPGPLIRLAFVAAESLAQGHTDAGAFAAGPGGTDGRTLPAPAASSTPTMKPNRSQGRSLRG